jgi:hypothetical protein
VTEEIVTRNVTNTLTPIGIEVINVRQLLDSDSRMSLSKWTVEFRIHASFTLMGVSRNRKVLFDNGGAQLHYHGDFCEAHSLCKKCLGSLIPVNTRDMDIYCFCSKYKRSIGTPEDRVLSKKAKVTGFASRMGRAHPPRASTAQAPAPSAAIGSGVARMNTIG